MADRSGKAVGAPARRTLHSERTSAGMRQAAARGVRLGRPRKPLNVKKLMAALYRGKSYAELARVHKISKSRVGQIVRRELLAVDDRRREEFGR